MSSEVYNKIISLYIFQSAAAADTEREGRERLKASSLVDPMCDIRKCVCVCACVITFFPPWWAFLVDRSWNSIAL